MLRWPLFYPVTNSHDNGGSAAAGHVKPGDVLLGKYRVEHVIGEGGMGVVVSAYHLHLDERVAIKFLLPKVVPNQEAVARFAREARAAVKIKSEHVARVIDVGTLETGSPYMVMELLQGADLSTRLAERGAHAVETAVEYVLQACEALAEAHSLGIIHRDLKPSNLFLTNRADGSACVKVLDFGISKVASGAGSELNMTKTAMVMGSPLYMSPEQMASARDVDARTDIWALGAILYELLSGRTPFDADSMPQLCAKILQQDPQPIRNLRPDLPDELQQVVLRCLSKDPATRYATVADLAQALFPFAPRRAHVSVERVSRVMQAAGLSASSISLSSAPPPLAGGGSTQGAWGQTAAPGTPSRRWLWAAIVAGVAVLGTGAALFASRSAGAPEAAAPSAASAAQPAERQSQATLEPIPSATPLAPSSGILEQSPSAEPDGRQEATSNPAPAAPAARAAPERARPSPAHRPAPKAKAAASAPAAARTAPRNADSLSDLYGDRK